MPAESYILLVETLVACCLSGLTCMVGDYFGKHELVVKQPWLRAMVDSGTHGLVGALSWAVIGIGRYKLRSYLIGTCLLAGFLSSLLDVDHFIMAKSLRLEAATSLPSRPPFHSTTIIPFIFLSLYTIQRIWPGMILKDVHWIFFISWMSHHIRDGNRRGLWFWPFGSTQPLPKFIYISHTMILPLFIKGLLSMYEDVE